MGEPNDIIPLNTVLSEKLSFFQPNMKSSSFLLIVLFYVFTQNSFAKYLLLKMDEKEQITTKSALDTSESENCLIKEGLSEDCVAFFKTGKEQKKCKEWVEENNAAVKTSEVKWKECVQKLALKTRPSTLSSRNKSPCEASEACRDGCN